MVYDDDNNTPDNDKISIVVFMNGTEIYRKQPKGSDNNYLGNYYMGCQWYVTYDKGVMKVTYDNYGIKEADTVDLTALEGWDANYTPNGKQVAVTAKSTWNGMPRISNFSIKARANANMFDAFNALALTDVAAAKNIYETLPESANEFITAEALAAVNGDFSLTTENTTVTSDIDPYRYGDTVTFTATAVEGYVFDGWYDADGNVLSTEVAYTTVITPDTAIVAKALVDSTVCAHDNIEVRGDVAATCTTAGNTGEVWCLDCGTKIVDSEVIPATGHTEETIPGKAATCGADGLTDGVKCSVCGEILVKQEVIPATGEHTYGDWVINEEAGTQTKTCTVCGATVTEEYIPPVTDIEGNWNEDGSITWLLTEDGTLTISGTGVMANSSIGKSPVQEYADRIKAVVIGDGITQIGSRAFRDMVNIESVTFGKDVTFINYEAFYGCTSLTTVSLNEGITQISSLVFSNTAIASIELPSTLTKLDARVFKGCANLDNVVIPDSVTYTGYELFMNCTSLTTFKWSAGCDWFNSLTFGGCTSLTKITVPKTVQHIKSSTFANCTALEEIDFEDSDTLFHVSSALPAIASTAFSGCSSTMVVKAWSGSAVENVAKAAGVTFQAKNDAPFKFVVNEDGVSCTVTGLRTNGATPTIPTTINGYTVTAIGDYAFRNNTTMTGINIAGTVETIGQGAFQNTKISTTVHIPESVKTIGVNAFADCAELTGVTFYGGVTDIQSGAFANCPKLSSLRRFQNLNTTIARNAFLNCTSLTSVQIGAGTTLNGNVFSGCVDTLTIKCTEGSSAYDYAVARGFKYELI